MNLACDVSFEAFPASHRNGTCGNTNNEHSAQVAGKIYLTVPTGKSIPVVCMRR
jgi:hypothetical protein